MDTVATSIDDATGGVKIEFTVPYDNSSPVDYYFIEISNKAGTTWTEDTTNCNGQSQTIIDQLYCIVPMSVLTANPYDYVFQDTVIVRISAHNTYGFGDASDPNGSGGAIRQLPDIMPSPTLVSKTETEAEVQWSTLTAPNNGDSDIIEYQLYYDNGSGTPNIKIASGLITSYTVSGLSISNTYEFVVKAVNIYGEGPESAIPLSMIPSDKPGQVDIVSISLSGTEVHINWNAPNDHNSALTEYDIQIMKSDGTFDTHADCDGTDATIKSDTECFIEMLDIPALTGQSVGDLIQAKVKAKNANGWGEYSNLNVAG